jgi:hypothetical protein
VLYLFPCGEKGTQGLVFSRLGKEVVFGQGKADKQKLPARSPIFVILRKGENRYV